MAKNYDDLEAGITEQERKYLYLYFSSRGYVNESLSERLRKKIKKIFKKIFAYF